MSNEVAKSAVGVKFDDNKVRLDLLQLRAIMKVGEVSTFGCGKYNAHNWEKGIMFSRLIAAAFRHIFKWMLFEDNDPETGISHIHHATWNLLSIGEFIEAGRTDVDDRSKIILTSILPPSEEKRIEVPVAIPVAPAPESSGNGEKKKVEAVFKHFEDAVDDDEDDDGY